MLVINAGRLNQDTEKAHPITGKAYLLVADGSVLVNEILAKKGDGITISNEASIALVAKSEAELLIIEVPGLKDVR